MILIQVYYIRLCISNMSIPALIMYSVLYDISIERLLLGSFHLLLMAFRFRLFLELVMRRFWASRAVQRTILSRLESAVSTIPVN